MSSTSSTAKDLPPKREGKAVKRVSAPLKNVRLSNLVYYLAALGAFFCVFYAYRIMQWKSQAGGWWNLAVGKKPLQLQQAQDGMASGIQPAQVASAKELDLEDHINGIASILGIKPTDLASAVSGVVKEHAAPKTLSSISSSASAADAQKTAVEALFGGDESINDESGGAAAKVGTVAKAVEALVGYDEPIMLR